MEQKVISNRELEIIDLCERLLNKSNEVDCRNEEIVQSIAKELEDSKSGWLDPNILDELVNVSSDYRYSVSKPFRLYQLVFSLEPNIGKQGEFVLRYRDDIFKILELVKSELESIGAGKMPYYKLGWNRIVVLMKIQRPDGVKLGLSRMLIQSHLELLVDKIAHTNMYPDKERWDVIYQWVRYKKQSN